MIPKTIYRGLIGLFLAMCANAAAFGQYMPTQSFNIPLSYASLGGDAYRLAIQVGINGGPLQSYLFDTGSPGFNAAYNPSTWNGFGGGSTTSVPASTVPNGTNVQLCYGSTSAPGTCRGYMGNIVQVPSLSFQAPGGGLTTLTTPPDGGFVMTAVSGDNSASQSPPLVFPGYFCDSPYACAHPNPTPPDENLFYGIFGAGNFTAMVYGCTVSLPAQCPSSTGSGPVIGSVLGQIAVQNPNVVAQGFVVAANGQTNVAVGGGVSNPPTGNAAVTIGGVSNVQVTNCNPCVTVGLTPQLIGQFAAVGLASDRAHAGLIPWTQTGAHPFPNPYGTTPGNNTSTETGANFAVSVTGTSSTQSQVAPGLLDTGTPGISLNESLSSAGTPTAISIAGTTQSGDAIAGLPTMSADLSSTNGSYSGHYIETNHNTIGLPFFMQNSVLMDFSGKAIGYTPYFVTDAPLVTTANGPLIVSGANVPLGLAGVISGPGGLVIQSGGQVQTSATNTYTGATTISAGGSLLVSGPGSIETSSGVTNDGVFDISRAWQAINITSLAGDTGKVKLGGNNLTITNASGSFSGDLLDGGSYPSTGGSLTIAGGTQTLAGTNTYTGGTLVSGGTLDLAGSMIGSLTIQSGATFNLSGSYSVARTAFLNNAGTFASTAGPLLNEGLVVNTGTISGGLTNSGTFVNNGILSGGLTNTGILSGAGTINGAFNNAGMVAPGNSIGTLSVVGSYAQTANSSYMVETNARGQSDLIAVSGAPGTATIAAGTSVYVAPAASGRYAPRTTYTILSTTGGVTGTYSSVTSIAGYLPFLLPSLSYDANNVYLNLQVGGFAAQAQTPNQAAVGSVLDAAALNAAGDFATVLGAFSTMNAQQGVAAMNSISGQNYSGFSSAGIATTQVFMANFANTVGGTSGGSNRVALAESCDVACDTTAPGRWGAWGGALGGFGVVGGTANAGTLTYNLGGFAAGLDRRVTDELLIGVTAGFTSGSQWVGGFSGRGISDTFQAGLYASYAKDAVYVDGLAAYAYSDNRMQRQITVPGLSRIANGRTGANLFFGQVEAGYRFDIGGLAAAYVTPFARLQGATTTQDAFTESGASALDLSVAAQTTNSLRSVLGAQLGGAMDLGWRDKLAMMFKLGWGHEYADTGRPVTASFVGAPALSFTTYGAAPQRDSVVLGLSATTALADATSLYFRYEGDISSQDSNHALTAGFRMIW